MGPLGLSGAASSSADASPSELAHAASSSSDESCSAVQNKASEQHRRHDVANCHLSRLELASLSQAAGETDEAEPHEGL